MRFTACLIFLALSLSSQSFGQNVISTIELAEEDVRGRGYENALKSLYPLLDQLKLKTMEEIVRTHRVLGVAHCETGNEVKALEHFDAMLSFSSSEKISDLVKTNYCKQLFEKAQGKGKRLAETKAVKKNIKNNPSDPKPLLGLSKMATDKSDQWKYWLPFGSGQFKNGEKRKGRFFLISEGVLMSAAITSLALFKAEENSEGDIQ